MKIKDDGSYDLDEKDRLLLSIIQQNAEISLSELGMRIGLTKMAVSNRIQSLKRAGIIEGTFTKVNGAKVGQDYMLITRITCSTKGNEQDRIAETIAKIPGVQSIYEVFGSFDMMIIARRKDKTAARDLVREIAKIHGVRNTVTITPHTVVKESLFVDTIDSQARSSK
jgi:Lrp/AsnC family transcriptional regulator, leucine-responsive regulatory protein